MANPEDYITPKTGRTKFVLEHQKATTSQNAPSTDWSHYHRRTVLHAFSSGSPSPLPPVKPIVAAVVKPILRPRPLPDPARRHQQLDIGTMLLWLIIWLVFGFLLYHFLTDISLCNGGDFDDF